MTVVTVSSKGVPLPCPTITRKENDNDTNWTTGFDCMGCDNFFALVALENVSLAADWRWDCAGTQYWVGAMDPLTVAPSRLQELIDRLTPRQLQIVELLARGKTTRDVTTLLSIKRITFQSHIRDACYRVEVDSKTQLIVLFVIWKLTQEQISETTL